jgi:PAS domain S-box-containing protein
VAFYDRAERTPGRHRVDYRLVTADGRTVWIRDLVCVERLGDRGPARIRGICMDVTEQKEAETALAEAETRYRSLVEQIPAVTYVYESTGDPRQGVHRYISPQVENVLGMSQDEWVDDAETWARAIHPDDVEFVLAEARRTDVSGDPYRIEYRMLARDGATIWVRDEAVVVAADDQGRPRLWQGVMYDVTEQRRMQAERQRLLVRLVQAQEEERRRIGGDIHDDSVQKMAAVSLRLKALRNRIEDPGTAQALDQLNESVQQAISRLRSLLFELRPPALDHEGLAAALRQSLDTAGREAGFEWTLANELPTEPQIEVRTIAYRIAQEAIANVRKHAQAREVDVRLSSRAGGVLTRVCDDGRGFVDTGRSEPGHGGLPTMRERAELAGGWLRVETAERHGTTVEFWIPMDEPLRRPAHVA